jgi:hypothetical protein
VEEPEVLLQAPASELLLAVEEQQVLTEMETQEPEVVLA